MGLGHSAPTFIISCNLLQKNQQYCYLIVALSTSFSMTISASLLGSNLQCRWLALHRSNTSCYSKKHHIVRGHKSTLCISNNRHNSCPLWWKSGAAGPVGIFFHCWLVSILADRVVNLLDELSAPTTLSEARGLPESISENPLAWRLESPWVLIQWTYKKCLHKPLIDLLFPQNPEKLPCHELHCDLSELTRKPRLVDLCHFLCLPIWMDQRMLDQWQD